ncbi:ribonuclease H-like domain-containing protein [Tanacetum coccineum]
MWRKKLNLQGDVINISNSAVSHVHQCKICDKVFPTGQALGGHKRCHWTGYSEAAQAHVQAQAQAISSKITSTGEAASTQTESGRIVLDIDLNEVPAIMMEDEGGDANANVNGNGYASSSYNSNMGYYSFTYKSRSLYGLKQAPRAWFQRFAAYAARVGFLHSRCDSSLFIYRQGSDTAYLLLYVDDIVLTASSTALLQRIIASLHAEFSMTDLGPLNYFLGVSVTRNTSGMFLSQQKYATEVLERAGMLTCNPCRTPVDTDSKLAAAGDPVSDPTLYRRLAGALQYLTFTRPDISYAVQQVCLFMHDPREPHFSALKRILRYVRGTLTSGLQLYSSTTSSLVAYSDADWAGCPTTRRSTSGYCVFLGNNLLSWSSKRQFTLSRSSAEAEYRGVANAVAETCWLRNLLRELHTPLSTATIVYCDNVSAVYLSSNPVQHQRTKHIEIDIHFVRDLVTTGHIRVLHVPSRYQYADIFTKGLPTALFDEFRDSLSVRSSPAQTAGGC